MLAALTTPIVSLTSSLDYSLFTYADVKEMTMRSIFEPKEDDSFFLAHFPLESVLQNMQTAVNILKPLLRFGFISCTSLSS